MPLQSDNDLQDEKKSKDEEGEMITTYQYQFFPLFDFAACREGETGASTFTTVGRTIAVIVVASFRTELS